MPFRHCERNVDRPQLGDGDHGRDRRQGIDGLDDIASLEGNRSGSPRDRRPNDGEVQVDARGFCRRFARPHRRFKNRLACHHVFELLRRCNASVCQPSLARNFQLEAPELSPVALQIGLALLQLRASHAVIETK